MTRRSSTRPARPLHRLAAEQHDSGGRHGADDDLVSRPQHQKLGGREALPRHLDLARDGVKRALGNGWLDREACTRRELDIGIECLRGGGERRARPEGRPRDEPRRHACLFDHRQGLCAVVDESRVAFLLRLWQRYPGLDAEEALAGPPALVVRSFRMDDAASCLHPVHRPRFDGEVRAKAVAVPDLAFEEIGDGREVDVRMRTHVDPLVGQELRRPHLVEEDEGTHHLPLGRRQRAAHLHLAEIDRAGDDQHLDGIDGCRRAKGGIGARAPAHHLSPVQRFRTSCHSGWRENCAFANGQSGTMARPSVRASSTARRTSACPTERPRIASGTSV